MPKFEFNRIADDYDSYYETVLGQQVDQVEKQLIWKYMIHMTLEKPVLEIGCGTGHWTKFFKQKGLQIYAIDISEKMLKVALKKNPEGIQFEKMSVEDLRYKDHYFENIISIASLEFVDNMDQAFYEIFRVLKPGGIFLVGCLNALSEIGQQKENIDIYRNAYFFTPDELKEWLSAFGKPEIDACAIIEGNQVRDYPDFNSVKKSIRLKRGAFLTGFVKKSKS